MRKVPKKFAKKIVKRKSRKSKNEKRIFVLLGNNSFSGQFEKKGKNYKVFNLTGNEYDSIEFNESVIVFSAKLKEEVKNEENN